MAAEPRPPLIVQGGGPRESSTEPLAWSPLCPVCFRSAANYPPAATEPVSETAYWVKLALPEPIEFPAVSFVPSMPFGGAHGGRAAGARLDHSLPGGHPALVQPSCSVAALCLRH